MTIQSKFNDEAIAMLDQVSKAIYSATTSSADSNGMYNYALQKICNSSTSLVNMTSKELKDFDSYLIEIFKYKGWIK